MGATPEEIKLRVAHKVKQIRGFYINLTVYCAVFFGCVIAWLAMGGGAFWPIWVLIGCGVAAFSEALRLGLLPVLGDILPFLRDDWEEAQKKNVLKSMGLTEADLKAAKKPSAKGEISKEG